MVNIPADWLEIEINNKFRFWLPPSMVEVHTRSIDSHVRSWRGDNISVHFDYGHFSDPLTLYSKKNSYKITTDQISGYLATIVSFKHNNGWIFTGVHFKDLGKDASGKTIKMTLVVEVFPTVDIEISFKIIKSIRFR